jgi:hypothetical protein
LLVGFRWGKLCERKHLGDLGLDGKITLKKIYIKQDGREHGLD